MKKYLFSILIFSLLLVGLSASAQVRESDVNISIYPSYPTPNQNVRATLNSQAVDLDKAFISWSLNGEELLRGIGKKEFQFNTGNLGEVVSVSALIDTTSGNNLIKSISVSPAEVDMLWEAVDSYTPPFYKGKALAGSQGTVKVVAIPSFASQSGTSSKNLSYTWVKDGKTQPQFSGWGKSYMVFQNSYLDTENEAEVRVSDLLGNTTAAGSITLTTSNPKILFYRNTPEGGTDWGEALSNGFLVDSKGDTIVAEPYFFSEKDVDSSNISLEWFLNGQKVEVPGRKNTISIALESEEHGSAVIKAAVENVRTLFQSAEKEIRVSF